MLKPFLLLLCVLAGLVACDESKQADKTDRYPWQISLMTDGSSRIFGIHLGVTTLAEARQQLGNTPKLALFENPDGQLSLEMFYKEFTRAGLTGKLILTAAKDVAVLQQLKEQAYKQERLASGVVQYYLDKHSLPEIDVLPITAMTYMPYADLTEEVVLARFGEPAEKIRTHEQAQHWLYPDKGLDLILNESGKDVLQYVSPQAFAGLVRPLHP